MSNVTSLWGDLPLQEAVRTPLIILREQATILTEVTNGLLEGVVRTRKKQKSHLSTTDFSAFLRIEAPALDGYSLDIVKVNYNLALYPVDLFDLLGGTPLGEPCRNEADFTAGLQRILSSEIVRNTIGMLLTQSRSEQQEAA